MTMDEAPLMRVDALEGRWRVERLGDMLPPMIGVSKEIRGRQGKVLLGPCQVLLFG